MAITTKLELRQSHSLVMTPQLQQAIKLLQLSNLDLAAFVEAELERNPLLEHADAEEGGAPAPEQAATPSQEQEAEEERADAADSAREASSSHSARLRTQPTAIGWIWRGAMRASPPSSSMPSPKTFIRTLRGRRSAISRSRTGRRLEATDARMARRRTWKPMSPNRGRSAIISPSNWRLRSPIRRDG